MYRDELKEGAYRQLGVNDLAFGIDISGVAASGEAKRRSIERTIATVESKRRKCIDGMARIVKWAYRRVLKKEVEFAIKAQDILSLSLTDKAGIANTSVANGTMSVFTAIEFLGIATSEEEIELIKSDLLYKEKLVAILTALASITREEELKVKVDSMTTELLAELGLKEAEEKEGE